jgi:hypothetical protein
MELSRNNIVEAKLIRPPHANRSLSGTHVTFEINPQYDVKKPFGLVEERTSAQ